MLTHLSLFSGIGGFDLGLEMAGVQTVAQCESDKYARRVLQHHWPEVVVHEDICELDEGEYEGVDIISGGFPCQDLSVAGRREGLSGERSGLFFQMCRVVAAVRPRLLLWENVPGLCNDPAAFSIICQHLADIGYFGAWRVLSSVYFGVPQPRRRVFGAFVARGAGGWACGYSILFEPEGGRGVAAPGSYEENAIAAAAAIGRGDVVEPGLIATPCMFDGSRLAPTLDVSMLMKRQMLPERQRCPVVVETDCGYSPMFKYADECSPCPDCEEPWCEDCDTHYADCNCVGPATVDDGEVGVDVRARLLLPVEAERLQGFPPGWTDVDGVSDTQRYKQLGNAVSVPVAYWLGLRARMALGDLDPGSGGLKTICGKG